MPAPRIERPSLAWNRRKRPDMSPAHKALVKQLPCLVCGRSSDDPHHLMRTGEVVNGKAMSRTSADKWALPVCRDHHDQAHDAGDDEAWFAAQGIDARAVARSLWSVTGDLEDMQRVIFRASQLRRAE
jgi:hypothetical protein